MGFMYNSKYLQVNQVGAKGGSTDECEIDEASGQLKQNPCRLGTTSDAFAKARRPLVVEWKVVGREICQGEGGISICEQGEDSEKDSNVPMTFITIAVHSTSKGGSTPLFGSLQPFLNGGQDKRIEQHRVISDFVDMLASVRDSSGDETDSVDGESGKLVMALGDFNELSGFPAM